MWDLIVSFYFVSDFGLYRRTGAKQASRVPFWFQESRQNHLVPGHLVPFFRPGHLVPRFGSPRPIFYNGF